MPKKVVFNKTLIMNAKDTLKKIAEALNIVSEEKPVEETVEQVAEPVQETAQEDAQEEQVESAQEEQPVEQTAEEPAEEPAAEEPAQEEQKQEEPKADPRVEELERQLADLKEILKNAMAQPEEKEIPEPPKPAEPKGLTHSPEKPVRTRAKGVGNKGEDIMSRVFKYMNNN